ncbi:glycine-rich domain-containing protein [Roseibium sediminicola]|uniref:TIGR04222 domain-containing protein n=1 Tax=Roseibium sediminicola TaxID=2933272 RepID=A0ABT0GV54_9HYPH|nr:hypothetical protein [Roseibium sp. CAU 1639]MCK7613309.1 hypothetical protein [Roseibium sp. CAU 1639]
MRDPKLWNRIRGCHPDDVAADLPFSRRLARDNAWSGDFAQRAILEYQRFAYLSQLGEGMVTPSDEVDQVWHLHLTYTKHYWGPFREALGGPLHHMPTKGGADQGALFKSTYAKTLDLYRIEFGEPPADIWPPEEIRFGRAPHFQRINTQEVWLIRKPRWPDVLKTGARKIAHTPARAWSALLTLVCLVLGTSIALAHGSPSGEGIIEKTRNMIWHWASEHTFEFVFSIFVIGFVLQMLFGKSSGRKRGRRSRRGSSGCSTSGNDSSCGSDSGGGGSGCGGCGGGD